MFKYFVAVAAAVTLVACGNRAGSDDAFTGTYSVTSSGTAQQVLKIAKDGEGYIAFEHLPDGSWRRVDGAVTKVSGADLQSLVGDSAIVGVAGVKGQAFVLLHTPVGWSKHGFTTKTGYVAILPFGVGDVERRS